MSKEHKLEFNDNYIVVEEQYENDKGVVVLSKTDDCSLHILYESYNPTHIDFFIKLIKYVADLEAKLADIEESARAVIDANFRIAEKEKELKYKTAECEKWKTDYKNCSELEKIMSKEHQYCLDNWRASEQDKISFCIERLVGVQKYISDNAVYVEEESFGREIKDFIDNQIEELKGR